MTAAGGAFRLACVLIAKVVASRLLINGKAAKLEHMAALHVGAITADTLLHNLKLLLQRLLQQVGMLTATHNSCNFLQA